MQGWPCHAPIGKQRREGKSQAATSAPHRRDHSEILRFFEMISNESSHVKNQYFLGDFSFTIPKIDYQFHFMETWSVQFIGDLIVYQVINYKKKIIEVLSGNVRLYLFVVHKR